MDFNGKPTPMMFKFVVFTPREKVRIIIAAFRLPFKLFSMPSW